MRLKHLIVATTSVALSLCAANAQSWSKNTYGLYVNPTTGTTGNVGVGIASTNTNKVTIKANSTTQPGLRIYNSAGSTKLLQSANGGLSIGTSTTASANGLLVQGASQFNSSLTVGGSAFFNSNAKFLSTAYFTKTIVADGAVSLNSSLTTLGKTTLVGALQQNGAATFNGATTFNNSLTASGSTTFNGSVLMKNSASIYNGLTVNVGTTVYNSVRITGSNGRSAISAYGYNNWDALDFTAREFIFKTGNVGIGVTTPQAKLHVAGKILCTGEIEVAESLKANEIKTKDIKVEMNNAADYVFSKDYNLKSLSEVESYVNENNHLPGVPSAAEMAKNGVSVSEMSNLLLEKVEELTLHMIQLEKENKALKAEVEMLKK